jgi:hypothetical protein
MSHNALFLLVLSTGVVLAGEGLEARPAAGDEAQAKTEQAAAKAEGVPVKTEGTRAKTEEAQGRTQEAQPKADGAQRQGDEAQAPAEGDSKLISTPGGKALGMSILGNQEAPTSLVIVPWKTSELGNSLGITPLLDDSRQPVDKEVFMRSLRYYEIRSETKR